MTRLLERAGVPKEALEIIPDIVDTCAACRTWSQPLPQSVASVNIPDKFNDQVECDIVFIHPHAILHFVDWCTRWQAAVLIPGKSEDSIIKALHSHWISIHGPMQELIMDGESGIAASARAGSLLSRLGIKFIPRAPSNMLVQSNAVVHYSAMSFIELMLNSTSKVCFTYLLGTAWQRPYSQETPWSL